jgi:8-oxo-dGTP pyrophosphatase MutT (NUDIX family)
MKEYALGFATTPHGQVLMAVKDEGSDGGAGLNGVGGKLEPGETPLECMEREWREETALAPLDWRAKGQLKGEGWRVHVFHAQRFATAFPHGDQVCVWLSIADLLWRRRGECTSWALVALAQALEAEAGTGTRVKTGS